MGASVKPLFSFVAVIILILPCVTYADEGARSQYSSKALQLQMDSVSCRNGYLTGYLNAVVDAINNATITSTITSTDIPKIGSDYTVLQSDATSNNAVQYKADLKIYTAEVKIANQDSRSALKTAHDKTVYSSLRSNLGQLKSTYATCSFGVQHQYAQLKTQIFTSSISHLQNMTNRLESHSINTTALSYTINLANSHVKTFETEMNNAQNKTQLQSAMKSFCLYNGCKTDNNFHLAATTAIEQDQAKLTYLASKNSTSSYQGLVIQAQADLTSAQTALSQVGSNQYQGTQSSDVWNNIKAAADLIHHLQQIVNHKH